MKTLLSLLTGCLLIGCAISTRQRDAAASAASVNAAGLAEESRALTTGALDSLQHAPTNAPVNLAKQLLERDQQIEGLPIQRIDVAGILAGQRESIAALERRMDGIDTLLQERSALAAKLRESEARLIEMGKLYEAERRRSIIKRIWAWSIGTLGLAGTITLCFFCPALILMFFRAAGWLAGKVPALIGALGVVGKQVLDKTVKGVGEFRGILKEEPEKTYTGEQVLEMLNVELLKATDETHRNVIDARRRVANV